MNAEAPEPAGRVPPTAREAGRVLRAWSALTRGEQRAVAIVVLLALLGLAVRTWHERGGDAARGVPAACPAAGRSGEGGR